MIEYLFIFFNQTYKILLLLVPVLVSVAMIVWLDRRVWAFVQKRRGPNVVGPFGLLQSLADGLKYIFKEIIVPASSNKIILLALAGIIISLKIYFKASAKDWNKPNGPTTLGPLLFWTKAQTLLSSHTIIATETKTGINKKRIL